MVADQAEIVARTLECRTALAAVKAQRYHFWDLTEMFDNANGRIVDTSLTLTAKMSLDAGNGMTVKMATRETRTLKVRATR